MDLVATQMSTFHPELSRFSASNTLIVTLLLSGLVMLGVALYFLFTEPEESWYKFWMRELPTGSKD